jgi:hypothetical protein
VTDPDLAQLAPTDQTDELAEDGERVVGSVDRDAFDPAELADDGNRIVPPSEPARG